MSCINTFMKSGKLASIFEKSMKKTATQNSKQVVIFNLRYGPTCLIYSKIYYKTIRYLYQGCFYRKEKLNQFNVCLQSTYHTNSHRKHFKIAFTEKWPPRNAIIEQWKLVCCFVARLRYAILVFRDPWLNG